MALDPVVNFFRSEIATLPVTAGAVTIVLASGDGAKLPNPAVDGAFNLTIYNEADQFTAPEIVRVTARSSDTLTVTRAQEGTSATTKTAGAVWTVVLTPTAKMITDIDTAKVNVADIVDNLTSTSTTAPLSANQGKVLQDGKLNLSGGTMTGDLTIPDKIIHAGDTDTAIRFPANDTVSVETNGAARLTIDSTGAATFSSSVTAGGDIVTPARIVTDTINGYTGGSTPLTIQTGGAQNIILGTNDTERMRITSAGNVGIGTTAPATKLDVVGSIRSSVGILFGTDTAEANTLDDYEEGTFTPTFIPETGAFATLTFSLQSGKYTKIGNKVTVEITLATSNVSVGTASGFALIGNLPFTNTGVDNSFASASLGICIRFATNIFPATSVVSSGDNRIQIIKSANSTDATSTLLQVSDLTTGATTFQNYISLTATYLTT